MIWVCNDITAMLCETLINKKVKRFELISPASNYLFKFNSRKSYEICSKLTIKTTDQCQWRRFGVFIVNLEHISHLFPVFTVDFKQLVVCGTAVKTVKSGHVRDQNKVSTLEGFHFRRKFRLKWRKTHKGSRVWKQKHSTYH